MKSIVSNFRGPSSEGMTCVLDMAGLGIWEVALYFDGIRGLGGDEAAVVIESHEM